ncbi:hypothetical protein BCEN4_580004 [Burkholderia cenocepacia]|nr:hypothetical protein BCEN4_580004 [Burkholderia cenocepacia]
MDYGFIFNEGRFSNKQNNEWVNIARCHDALCCKKVKRHCGSEPLGLVIRDIGVQRASAVVV